MNIDGAWTLYAALGGVSAISIAVCLWQFFHPEKFSPQEKAILGLRRLPDDWRPR